MKKDYFSIKLSCLEMWDIMLNLEVSIVNRYRGIRYNNDHFYKKYNDDNELKLFEKFCFCLGEPERFDNFLAHLNKEKEAKPRAPLDLSFLGKEKNKEK